MTRKHWILLTAALVLGGLSLYLNQDWFAHDGIQIYHRSRVPRSGLFRRKKAPAILSDAPTIPVIFAFDHRVKLTSVKVFPVSDIATNKYPHPVWDLISDSNSVPIKDFTYGGSIAGMRPAVKGATADPLEPDVNYRLCIEAGPLKADHDFVPLPKP
ncbi:MAG: hypothetical protein QOJ40_871 [Verrucomicrobiota bacterium]